VGISQIANMVESEKLAYTFVLNTAEATRNKVAVSELSSIHPPYKGRTDELMIERKWQGKFGAVLYGESNYDRLIEIARASTEYSLADLLNIEPGTVFSTECLWAG
jgi:hypothetical protein